MILEIIGQAFAAIQAFLQFGMGTVAGDDDRAVQQQAGFDRMTREFSADLIH